MAARSKLGQFILRRILQLVPVIILVVCLVFVFCRVAPGDPVYYIGGATISDEYYHKIKAELGLDKPIYIQFLLYMKNVVRGDLGYSTVYQAPVTNIVIDRMLNSLVLIFSSIVLASLVGVAFGVLSSRQHYSLADNIISVLSLIGYSQPLFWMAMLMILLFSGSRLPVQGMFSIGADLAGFTFLFDFLKHLVLPAVTLGIYQVALFARLTRSSMLEVLMLDFITTAKAMGLSEWKILISHALRNALIPVVTLFGLQMGHLFSGSALVEVVFGWPGLGSLMLDAVTARDYPILSGIFIFVSFAVIMSNLIADIIYAKLDPRIVY